MEFAELILTPKLDGVILHSPFHDPVDGTLCITGHHLILSSRQEGAQELWLLHKCIDIIEKKPNIINNVQKGGSIVIKCKDLRIITLDIGLTIDFNNVYTTIEKLYMLDNTSLLYPFFYRPMYNILENGYTMFQPEIEFAKLLSGEEWRLSSVNKDYTVCPTYGATLVVPKGITDDVLKASAAFREGGRFPILSYRHENGAILMRSSQPLTGTNNRRCKPDESILNGILVTNKRGYIVDTRSSSLVNQCRGRGGGTEIDQHYNQWRKIHRQLDKVSTGLVESFTKFIEACNDTQCSTDKWLSRLDSCGWLSHVLNSLAVACLVAQCMEQEGSPVLVHGSKGLDSTLLVTSLVQVILNPDCRTVRGLQALVEREWLQSGYPFATRHSRSCYGSTQNGKSKQNGASFVLFLDCVHQLHKQFPCSFEFTTHLLVTLFEHSYYSQFGSFLGNCEKDRMVLKVYEQTTSLWSYLNRPDILTSLLNPMYEPNPSVIWPSVAPISIVLWSELYLRWVIDMTYQKKAFEQIKAIITREKELRSKVVRMRKQVLDLQKEVIELGIDPNANSSTAK